MRPSGLSTARGFEGVGVRDLSWRPVGRAQPTLVIDRLDLRPGEHVLLAGASGSGKSTLLRALAGLLDETVGDLTGTVTVDGHPPQERPGAVGLLLQDPRHSVVAEHVGRDVAFGPENRALPRSEIHARVEKALLAVRFPYDAARPTGALSGGEGARLALAGALALDPRLLLLDEPTAMLDPESAAQVRDAVRRTADTAGLTLVVAEHQLAGWLEVCSRLIVLDQGRILFDGPADQVLREHTQVLLDAGVWVPGAPDPVVTESTRPVSSRPGPGCVPQRVRLSWARLELAAPDCRQLAVGLSGELHEGAGLAVVGPSGAGKSTLLRVLAGLSEPATGAVTVGAAADGSPLEPTRTSTQLARQIGWATQHSEQSFTARTVQQEIRATGDVLHAADPVARAAAHTRAEELMDDFGLSHLRDADPYSLSGGEQRRVVLAAALAHDPEILLLDEPTVGQDRQTWAAVAGALHTARQTGAAVVATTHDPRLAARLGSVLTLRGEPAAAGHHPDYRIRPVAPPDSPPAARCNPLTFLATAVLAGVGSFWVTSYAIGLATLAITLLLSPLAVRRVRPVLLRLVPVALAALSVGWSTLLLSPAGAFAPGSGMIALREVTRILCLVTPGALLVGLLRPSSLGDALSQRLHLPARPVVAASAALLRIDDLLDTWRAMSEIRRVRGLAPGRSPRARIRHALSLTLALLVGTLRSAQQMALSMDARGFAAMTRRSHALPSTFSGRDAIGLACGLILLVTPIALNHGLAP